MTDNQQQPSTAPEGAGRMTAMNADNMFTNVWTLMREDGLDTEAARERLHREVDLACDAIEYGENDEDQP